MDKVTTRAKVEAEIGVSRRYSLVVGGKHKVKAQCHIIREDQRKEKPYKRIFSIGINDICCNGAKNS